jgi:beta-carotene hydroxylase
MSVAEERAIADKYIGQFPAFMVVWGLGGFFGWLALFPLVHSGFVPYWLGTVLAVLITCYCYLPSHEAQHGNIGKPGARWRWLNEFIGHTSMFPLLIPYRLHRVSHMQHHSRANDPERDPDMFNQADNVWGALKNGWLYRQPVTAMHAGRLLPDTEEVRELGREAFAVVQLAWVAMAVLAFSGFALELLLLWWIPRQIALSYILLTLSWAPHHPMKEQGRYRDTRGWKSPFGTVLSAGMEYHLIHHLFPNIPLDKTPAAYRDLKPTLEAEGMSLNGL